MAPGNHDDATPRLAHARQLPHELRLVGHVLPALHGPDEVKLPALKGLVQGICHLEADLVPQALRLGQLVTPGSLQTPDDVGLLPLILTCPASAPGPACCPEAACSDGQPRFVKATGG